MSDGSYDPLEADIDPPIVRAQQRVGTVLKEKWRLDALLGFGGMAAVYSATHRNQKRVAVKVLHGHYSNNEELRSRFLREGYAANIIEHPGAVSVLDDDVAEDGAAFLVMELLEGETLEARWERKGQKLEVFAVLDYLDQVLDTLAAAHAKGIVHRDIKPENLFLTRDGTVKVLDFGIARILEGSQDPSKAKAKATSTGVLMGTPAFMAPEQARGRWDLVDGRTDLWALAASAFTLLSGRTVHEGADVNELLIKSATKPAPSLAQVVHGIPPRVVTLVDRGLVFAKEQRWADARTMQEAVRATRTSLETASQKAKSPQSLASIPKMRAVSAAEAPAITQMKEVSERSLVPLRSEREARAEEAARNKTLAAELEIKLEAAKQKTKDAEARVTSARAERHGLEQVFTQHVGTRNAEVEDSRRHLRGAHAAFARTVLEDTANFGDAFAGAREQIAALKDDVEAKSHDLVIATKSLTVYDERAYGLGIRVAIAAFAFLLLIFFFPVIYRFFLAG